MLNLAYDFNEMFDVILTCSSAGVSGTSDFFRPRLAEVYGTSDPHPLKFVEGPDQFKFHKLWDPKTCFVITRQFFICIHIIHESFPAAATLYLGDSRAGLQGKRCVQRLYISFRGRNLTDGNSRLCVTSRAHQKPLCLSTAKGEHSVCISVFAGGA